MPPHERKIMAEKKKYVTLAELDAVVIKEYDVELDNGMTFLCVELNSERIKELQEEFEGDIPSFTVAVMHESIVKPSVTVERLKKYRKTWGQGLFGDLENKISKQLGFLRTAELLKKK